MAGYGSHAAVSCPQTLAKDGISHTSFIYPMTLAMWLHMVPILQSNHSMTLARYNRHTPLIYPRTWLEKKEEKKDLATDGSHILDCHPRIFGW